MSEKTQKEEEEQDVENCSSAVLDHPARTEERRKVSISCEINPRDLFCAAAATAEATTAFAARNSTKGRARGAGGVGGGCEDWEG